MLHSATKFISGHGTTIGGVLVESGTFPWGNGRYPLLSEPSPGYHQKVFTETFGEYAFLMRARAEVLRDVGAQMSPMDAWLHAARARNARRCAWSGTSRNAREIVAHFCETRDEVAWVREPQLGSIFTFGLRGGRDAGRRFIDALELWSHLANVGDAKSLVIHPASTTHSQLSDDETAQTPASRPKLVRLSVGLEDAERLDLGSGSRARRCRDRPRHVS